LVCNIWPNVNTLPWSLFPVYLSTANMLINTFLYERAWYELVYCWFPGIHFFFSHLSLEVLLVPDDNAWIWAVLGFKISRVLYTVDILCERQLYGDHEWYDSKFFGILKHASIPSIKHQGVFFRIIWLLLDFDKAFL
jgi:hypothetical protein